MEKSEFDGHMCGGHWIAYEYLTVERISKTKHAADTVVRGVNNLLVQLTASPKLMTHERALKVAAGSYWLVARTNMFEIIGMNSLTISTLPTGDVGNLDDVVLDQKYRGKGIGERLITQLVNRARSEKLVDRIRFTCNPTREAANKLYQKLGFQHIHTNNYMLKL